ncbi:MAG TPA: tripartite tricarboxylate transporter substrate-binding protein [Burkholderiales bacterium]|nr:tripartite tricarboxylate transporter substrate-binding protein [Burkholderiales bacterium]
MPLGPGNSLEIAMRLVAEKLTSALGQPFVIEAQPGAAGQIGTERVARSPADGYTLLCANDGIITMLPNLQKHVRFDPVRDFSPIAQMVGIPYVLIVHPSVQAKNAEELVQLAKARSGKLEYSSGGLGSAQQLAMELFMSITGTSFVHVPYKGAPQAAMDVVSGQIPVALAGVPIAASLIKQGRLRALGVASDHRLALLPKTPTLAEQGIPLTFVAWGGLFAPAGTPADIIRRLNQETRAALGSPDVQARMAEFGLEIYGNSPEQFAEVVRTDLAKIASLVKRAGIEPQ